MALANGHFTVSPFAHVVALRVNLNYHSSWRPSRLKSDGQTSVLLIFDLSSVNCCRLCHARGVHAIASILESLQFGPFPFGPDTAWHQSRWWSDIIQGCNQQDFPVVCQLQPNEPITLSLLVSKTFSFIHFAEVNSSCTGWFLSKTSQDNHSNISTKIPTCPRSNIILELTWSFLHYFFNIEISTWLCFHCCQNFHIAYSLQSISYTCFRDAGLDRPYNYCTTLQILYQFLWQLLH